MGLQYIRVPNEYAHSWIELLQRHNFTLVEDVEARSDPDAPAPTDDEAIHVCTWSASDVEVCIYSKFDSDLQTTLMLIVHKRAFWKRNRKGQQLERAVIKVLDDHGAVRWPTAGNQK